MKKLFLFMFSISIAFITYAQTTETLTYPNGSKYEGKMKDGKRQGQGTMTWANGDKYTGE
ncbi:MAG: hypothetical protein NTX03_07045 [Bacteroidetes bacterium]|nr:hypothetical protein [Bacteroidota bacterium]